MSVTLIRPYYTLDWTLSQMWDFRSHPHMEPIVRYIEPKIVRGINLPCWLWIGRLQYFNRGMDNEYAYPTVNLPLSLTRKSRRDKPTYVHRFMASCFWEYPSNFIVFRTCRQQGCVNPQHFAISYRNDPLYN